MIKANHALFILSALLLLACGKEQKQSSESDNSQREILPLEIEKQTLFCEPGASCPSFISKILIRDNGEQRFCTGTLVAPNVVLTSTSCLPPVLRSPGVDCAKHLYFFFHKNDNGTPQSAGCKKIIQVSTLAGSSTLNWRDDVAFVEIDKNLYNRRQLAISREGVSDDKEYKQVSIEQVDQYKSVIRHQNCNAVFNSYINPLAKNEYSPGIVVSGCTFPNGTAGSPLLDKKGRVIGVLSQAMSTELRQYIFEKSGWLLGQPLKTISHATNFACAPSLYDNYQMDEEECSKSLEQTVINTERGNLIDPSSLFASSLREIKREMSANDFVEFGVRFNPLLENSYTTEIFPVCFKNVNSWINRFRSNPNFQFKVTSKKVTLKRMMNPDGRMLAFQSPAEKQDSTIYFSPKNLSISGKSYVTMIDPKGRSEYTDLLACP